MFRNASSPQRCSAASSLNLSNQDQQSQASACQRQQRDGKELDRVEQEQKQSLRGQQSEVNALQNKRSKGEGQNDNVYILQAVSCQQEGG